MSDYIWLVAFVAVGTAISGIGSYIAFTEGHQFFGGFVSGFGGLICAWAGYSFGGEA